MFCVQVTHTDLTWSSFLGRQKKFRQKGFNFCLWHWKGSSEARRKRKTKISGPPRGCLKTAAQSSGGNNTSHSSESVTLIPAWETPTLWWMSVTAATRPPTPTTGLMHITLNFCTVNRVSITEKKSLRMRGAGGGRQVFVEKTTFQGVLCANYKHSCIESRCSSMDAAIWVGANCIEKI